MHIQYATMPHNFIFIAFAMVLPKLFLNSLLALLNSRDVMRDMYDGQPVSIHFSKFVTPNGPSNDQVGVIPGKAEAIASTPNASSLGYDGVDCVA
ncbi:hypothetical protein PHLGIDRAFT_441751 [Phlebiopsis gigantea 11061_1 CR5-6]|uniref:DUF6534 domain-containing protein n=1 Tax=Phlebiopsis gigantea (strain 11061_1 CR5-6) TaxID=745531 RepID=A0A0C3NP92_PHLG1|nr:hypothetical protein PHLGIDRAFT_441751 [Phlebiopsis gigantea 11061_1 CR5-6]